MGGPPGVRHTGVPARSGDAGAAGAADTVGAAGAAGATGVDVSAQRAVIGLSGPRVRDVLVTGCRIDLHPAVFAVGAHTRTLLARVPVVLHRTGPDVYLILVDSSLAEYLAEWLLDALEGL
nr:sarcosine oxidase subunit gamma family protein [Planobispora rosea]